MKIYCPECENACSEKSRRCPRCGHPLARNNVIYFLGNLIGKNLPTRTLAIYTLPIIAVIAAACYYAYSRDSSIEVNASQVAIEDKGEMGLYLLTLADRLPVYHDKQMWILATWMLFHGYTDSDGVTPIYQPLTVWQSTFGVRKLYSPDQSPYKTNWKLCRTDSPMCGISFFSFAVDSNYNYELERAFWDEWFKIKMRGPFTFEERNEIDNLFSNAIELWSRDRHPAYYSNPSKSDTEQWIKKNRLNIDNRYDSDSPPYYTIRLLKQIGNYSFSIMIREELKWANEPPSTYILVGFEYIEDDSENDS